MKNIFPFLSLCFLIQPLSAQYQIGIIPRVSPDKMVYQKIGYTEVEIQYGSPAVNDRPIWGALVPYNKVWRAGANSATTVEFKSPVTIGGKTLDSGKYAFFIIPKENDTWTAIFNKVSKQWGAFRYNEEEDALRLDIRPRTTNLKTENLSYTINQTGFKHGSIVLAWDFLEIEIPFETNYLAAFEQEIRIRVNAQPEYIKWIPYLQGAEHLEQIKDNLTLGKTWLTKAEEIMHATQEWNEQFYPRPYVEGHLYWIKAKVLAWEESYAEAIEYVEKLRNMESPIYYEKKGESEEIDLYYNAWKDKI